MRNHPAPSYPRSHSSPVTRNPSRASSPVERGVQDAEMLELSVSPGRRRPSLSTSAADFALATAAPPSPSALFDDAVMNPLFRRLRRPSLLGFNDGRLQSPLSSMFSVPRTGFRHADKDSIASSSSMSDLLTPLDPLPFDFAPRSRPQTPSTPPRRASSSSLASDSLDSRIYTRRMSHPLKAPRLLSLRAEAHPVECELKSEAQFQRLLAAVSDSPINPRALRTANRGRFPEEVKDEPSADIASSDDDDDDETLPPNPYTCSTPSEERAMSEDSMVFRGSPAGSLMDLDAPIPASYFSSHSSSSGSTPRDSWRQTPPPTTSNGARVNKRKYTADDRYDPYPTSTKRRAVSPSVSTLHRDSLLPPIIIPRSPILIPRNSTSAASSPIFSRAQPAISSPVMRPISAHMSSPILRPIVRLTQRGLGLHGNALGLGSDAAGDRGERDVDGAGDAVNGLRLA